VLLLVDEWIRQFRLSPTMVALTHLITWFYRSSFCYCTDIPTNPPTHPNPTGETGKTGNRLVRARMIRFFVSVGPPARKSDSKIIVN